MPQFFLTGMRIYCAFQDSIVPLGKENKQRRHMIVKDQHWKVIAEKSLFIF
jgi:hypothetical protein